MPLFNIDVLIFIISMMKITILPFIFKVCWFSIPLGGDPDPPGWSPSPWTSTMDLSKGKVCSVGVVAANEAYVWRTKKNFRKKSALWSSLPLIFGISEPCLCELDGKNNPGANSPPWKYLGWNLALWGALLFQLFSCFIESKNNNSIFMLW